MNAAIKLINLTTCSLFYSKNVRAFWHRGNGRKIETGRLISLVDYFENGSMLALNSTPNALFSLHVCMTKMLRREKHKKIIRRMFR